MRLTGGTVYPQLSHTTVSKGEGMIAKNEKTPVGH